MTAEAEALDLSHNYVGTEHILLALARVERSIAGGILNARGIRLDVIRRADGTVVPTDAGAPR